MSMSSFEKGYTKPKLRERLKAKIMAGSKGGRPGQWSARKAQLLAQEYEKAGGGYTGKKTKKQKNLSKWTKQKWTTESGKPSGKTGEVYAPKKTIEQLRGTKKLKDANAAKRKATREGKQHADHGLHEGKKRKGIDVMTFSDLVKSSSRGGKYGHINFRPPASVASAAKRGLDYRKKASPSNRGGLTASEASKQGIGSGVARAANLKNRTNVSPKVIRQMVAFFSRHEKNKAISPENKGTPWNDKGYVAWLLWGGDPGKAWANKVKNQMDAADKKKTSKGNFSDLLKGVHRGPKLTKEEAKCVLLAKVKGGLKYDRQSHPEYTPDEMVDHVYDHILRMMEFSENALMAYRGMGGEDGVKKELKALVNHCWEKTTPKPKSQDSAAATPNMGYYSQTFSALTKSL